MAREREREREGKKECWREEKRELAWRVVRRELCFPTEDTDTKDWSHRQFPSLSLSLSLLTTSLSLSLPLEPECIFSWAVILMP